MTGGPLQSLKTQTTTSKPARRAVGQHQKSLGGNFGAIDRLTLAPPRRIAPRWRDIRRHFLHKLRNRWRANRQVRHSKIGVSQRISASYALRPHVVRGDSTRVRSPSRINKFSKSRSSSPSTSRCAVAANAAQALVVDSRSRCRYARWQRAPIDRGTGGTEAESLTWKSLIPNRPR